MNGNLINGPMSKNFWKQALSLPGSVTPRVAGRVAVFAAFAEAVRVTAQYTGWNLQLPIAPYEAAGAVLGILLVMRTNAGYDRWWEARKLWGGIVNQTRNLATMAIAYGPADPSWRQRFVRLAAVFSHAVRRSLRGEAQLPEAKRLLGAAAGESIEAANHMPIRVSQMMAAELRKVADTGGIDRFAFMQVERERASLIDHLGACERILKTPLPTVYAIKIRRFLLLFLTTLPFAIIDRAGEMTSLIVALIAYSLLALDQIGVELEDPFNRNQLSHLPLDQICETIERNVLDAAEAADCRNEHHVFAIRPPETDACNLATVSI